MKTVILAGGMGSRLSEETQLRPKPMVDIGDKPILWHIMNVYAAHGFDEFVIALGYRGEYIKEYFQKYYLLNNDLSIDLARGNTTVHDGSLPEWKIHLVDTGLHTMSGGRLRRLRRWLGDEPIMMTYGDGVANVDVRALVAFHRRHGKLATLTAVRPPARFGALTLDGDLVSEFTEKPQSGEGWLNGGFFVLEPGVFEYLDGDSTIWERTPLERIAADGQLTAYRHEGFWQPMDTLRDKTYLCELWEAGKAPWKVW